MIGAGFTGLAAAVELVDQGIQVEVFEKEKQVGGLANGFDLWIPGQARNDRQWRLEVFYHHVFSNDREIIEMAKKVGLPAIFFEPVTSSFIDGEEIRLDSPISTLLFRKLSIFSRVRMGMGLLVLKLIPNGLFLEKYRVVEFLPKLIGKEAYDVIWKKLLVAKFGSKRQTVNMAWFWSRVAKRTKSLGYFEGGFQALAEKMKEYAEAKGAIFHLDQEMKDDQKFDRVISTIPTFQVEYLWGQTLILEIEKSFMKSYWLNILEKDWPFLVVVEHTNMIEKKYYGDKVILYVGNYLEEGNEQLKMTKEKLMELYLPYLKKINKGFEKSWVKNSWVFRKPYAQPVFPINYSVILDKMVKAKGKYIFANMSMVYPYDRGTNYAVKMGVEIVKLFMDSGSSPE